MNNHNYFELRNIHKNYYSDYIIPSWILKTIHVNDKILDYGCGYGQFLTALKKTGYTNIKGIDICSEAVQVCIKNGLDVELINDDDLKKYRGCFDFITLSHVLEHIPKSEIISFLGIVKTLLNDNGKLIIMVPNAQSNTGCYWAYEDFTHTTLFTTGSLFYVLKAAGFSQIDFVNSSNVQWNKIYRVINILRVFKSFLLQLYKLNRKFWNLVTESSYHKPSPECYSYEIRAVAKK